MAILNALNISVEGDGDEKVSFNLIGCNKSIVIDKEKMKEAITIQDSKVDEKEASADGKPELPSLNPEELGEEEFIKQAVELIGKIKKTP